MTMATGRTTRVIGWYHSHPHITVLPSHVDVRTQAMYQLLDAGFIGLIFSCFSEDAQKVGRIQVIAFQSLDGKQQNHILRPISLSPVHKTSVIDLESSLSSADTSIGGSKISSLEQDTGDSRAAALVSKGGARSTDLGNFFANVDNRVGESLHANSLSNAIIDVDPMDMSESMQEAMHRSNLEMSGAEYVRKEIPLLVLPSSSLFNLDAPLNSFTDLQRVLFEEERTAYNQAVLANMSLSPAISALQDQLRENEIRLKMLSEEAKVLESEIVRGEPNTSSPRRGSASSGQRDLYSPTELRSVPGSSKFVAMVLVSVPDFNEMVYWNSVNYEMQQAI
ncbi:Lys-63-specific deubiquitinase BRCC36 [Capsicum annuum]|nr:Lys-63-specific deubiquitinase BRCC36 [Capsicum annuum]